MKSAQDLNIEDEFVKVFVTGMSGEGKSIFASTFPTPGYVFDFDSGIKTYRGMPWDYSQYPLTSKGWMEFDKDVKEVEKAVNDKKYKTVVIDSTTAMSDLAMSRAMVIDPKRSSTDGPLWNVHYQIVRNLMDPMLKRIISLDCNIVVLAHYKIERDEDTGSIISIDPLLVGQLSAKVPGYFDEVYTTFVKTKEGKPNFYLRTITKGFFRARSRISGKQQYLPDIIPNDYPSLMAAYKDGLAAATAAQSTKIKGGK